MVLYLIITGLVMYYLALWGWYHYSDNKDTDNRHTAGQTVDNPAKNYVLVGESRYKGGQTGTNPDISGHAPQAVGQDANFTSGTGETEPDGDFEMTFDTDEEADYEDEEIAGYMADDETGRASGVSFDELGEAVRTANAENPTETEKRQAAGTLASIEGTNLFDAVVENINGGQEKVAELLKRNEAGLVTAAAPAEATDTGDKEYEAFDMNEFL